MQKTYFTVSRDDQSAYLALNGDWTLENLPCIQNQLKRDFSILLSSKSVIIKGNELLKLDTSGAWLLISTMRKLLNEQTVMLSEFNESHHKIYHLINDLTINKNILTKSKSIVKDTLISIGEKSCEIKDSFYYFLSTLGKVAYLLFSNSLHPQALRMPSIIANIDLVTIKGIMLTAILSFLLSIILGYQGVGYLQYLGAQIYTIDLVSISMLREMGVLMTSIIVAARVGSALTSSIGVMKANEEIAALQTMGLDPYELIVFPKIVAIIISLPLLTFIANCVGLLGAGFTTFMLLDLNFDQFLFRLKEAVTPADFAVGLIKAPIFGLMIGISCCQKGMQTQGGAANISKMTTQAIVQSIILIVVADALLSLFFTSIGI